MKTTPIVIGIIVVIVAGAGIWYLSAHNSMQPISTTPTVQTQPSATSTAAAMPAAPATGQTTVTVTNTTTTTTPAPKSFVVNGNDATADLKTITVAKGTPVSITFGADSGTTYHGGLDFRSSVVNTGTIAPGSTKTITFTADKSFAFTPYWPATNIAKPYTINIVVQ